MVWSPEGSVEEIVSVLGWTPEGPEQNAAPVLGWHNSPQRTLTDLSGTSDSILVKPRPIGMNDLASSDYIYGGIDPSQDLEINFTIRESFASDDSLSPIAMEIVKDDSGSWDTARLGIRPIDSSGSSDIGIGKAYSSARDSSCSSDALLSNELSLPPVKADVGIQDSCSSRFAPISPATTIYNSGATFKIPVMSRWIEVILLGGGGGGGGHAAFSVYGGQGGESGWWNAITLERGVDIPWTAINVTIAIGSAGSAGSGNASGSAGGATTATRVGYGTFSADGGPGGRGTGTAPYGDSTSGGSPGTFLYSGVNYPGGSGGSAGSAGSNGGAATAPGGGGGGASAGVIFGSKNGGAGSVGRAILVARN